MISLARVTVRIRVPRLCSSVRYSTVYVVEQYPYEYRILYGNVVEFSFCCFFVRFRIIQCNKSTGTVQYPCIDRIYSRDRDRERQTDGDTDRDRDIDRDRYRDR